MNITVMTDGDRIVLLRDNREQMRIEIKDALAPRGEQILRMFIVSFPKHWQILGTDASGDNTIFIQMCSQD